MSVDVRDGDQAEQKARLFEAALSQSESGQWQESVESNRAITELDPTDTSAFNRLGRSLTKLGRLGEALGAYQRALEVDPANAVAKRNSTRLQQVLDSLDGDTVPAANAIEIRAENFVMETGRSSVIALEDLSPADQIATILPGDTLELRADRPYLRLYTLAGGAVGVVPASVAHRLLELMDEGNAYSADVVSASVDGVQVLIRETYRAPETLGKLPFPTVTRQAPESRAALRAVAADAIDEEFVSEPDMDEDDTEEPDETATTSLPETDDTDDSEE